MKSEKTTNQKEEKSISDKLWEREERGDKIRGWIMIALLVIALMNLILLLVLYLSGA